MLKRLILLTSFSLLLVSFRLLGMVLGQPQTGKSLVERLGYSPDTKLLIIHADDLGLANSVNRAIFAALQAGRVSSASITVPCPWVLQVAVEAKSHPEWDLGVHLTMNAEWKPFKWGPVAPVSKVRSLVDPLGYLHETLDESLRAIDPAEAETEVPAQVERLKALGVQPTHLDSHMGTLLRTPQLFGMMLRVTREYRLPVMLPGNMLFMAPYAKELITEQDIILDCMLSMYPGHPGAQPRTWSKG